MEFGKYAENVGDVVVVTAKHVGTLGKAPNITPSFLNSTAICQVDAVPSMHEYYTGIL